jgi:hypothetical protein
VDPLGKLEGVHSQIAGDEIHLLAKPQPVHERWVVRRVVVHHGHCRAEFEALHQHAVPIQSPEALGTHQLGQAAPARPIQRLPEQGFRHGEILDALKQVELPLLHSVVAVVRAVLQHGQPANRISLAQRQQEVRLGMLVEGVFGRVQLGAGVEQDGGHPERMIAV